MIRRLLLDEWRFLTFRRMSSAVREHAPAYMAFGLLFTWLAGVGRYWDNPRALWWQSLGLGSLLYVFILALIIWGLLIPLRPRNWSYRNVLLFIALTAPPAVLYAIPVERFMTSANAVDANILFLAVVATWRVALYAVFLKRIAGLSVGRVIVATLLPLAIIVIALTALNLEHVVFNLMGGLREDEKSANDGAYFVVLVLSALSFLVGPLVLIAYFVLIYRSWRGVRAVASEGPRRASDAHEPPR